MDRQFVITLDTLRGATESELESVVVDWLRDHRVPGAAVAVVDGDETVYAEGFGARCLEENEPATSRTLFGVGSCTKPFVATAIVQLVERGILGVEDPVDDYLPHLADVPGEPITIRELLTHTSGLPVDGMASSLIDRRLGSHDGIPISSRADFQRHVRESTDRRVTDRKPFQYYNSGYAMLGLVIESVTGQDVATHVEECVLAPLGMDRATFSESEFEAADDRMTPYVADDDGPSPATLPFDSLLRAPGGLCCPVSELAAFLGVLGDDGRCRGETLLPAERLTEMTRPVSTARTYFDGRTVEYGYGFEIESFLDDRLIGHGGNLTVSSAWFGFLEERNLGVALACTTSPEAPPKAIGTAIMALLIGEEPAEVVPYYRLRSALEAVAGTYEGYHSTGTATVERLGGVLEFRLGEEEVIQLNPTEVNRDRLVCATTFPSGYECEVRFELDADDVDLFFEGARFTTR